jgi:hypothetical protein
VPPQTTNFKSTQNKPWKNEMRDIQLDNQNQRIQIEKEKHGEFLSTLS